MIGAGRSGLAACAVLRERGIKVYAYDDFAADGSEQAARLAQLGVALISKQAVRSSTFACAVVSPGVPLDSYAVQEMRKAGVCVYSEVEVAYRLCRAPIIAVTGTKGKSTTAALIAHLLRTAGKRVRLGGNIGNPLIAETARAQPDEWIVAEVSSFQLETIEEFAPHISVLLNVFADHLDRYDSLPAYERAKLRIFENQGPRDVFIGNAGDPVVGRLRSSATPLSCQARWFAREPGAGISLWLRGNTIAWNGPDGNAPETIVAQLSGIRLRGMHNLDNALAATLAALCAGAGVETIGRGLLSFAPLDHRLSVVETADGITWVDDSKATNPRAAISALESFAAPLVIIAGGAGKNADFTELGRAASQRCKLVVLIGDCAPQIAAHIAGPPVVRAPTLGAAVDAAAAHAKAGDVVLLSPGAASFDMFASAEERGEKFAALVRERTVPVSAQ